MIAVGQTYEQHRTGTIYTVIAVAEAWYSYGDGGVWKSRQVPRVKLMAVVPAQRAGDVIDETVPTGDLRHYGYTQLA